MLTILLRSIKKYFKDVSRDFDDFGSILIFASCVVGTCNILPGTRVSFCWEGSYLFIYFCFVLTWYLVIHVRVDYQYMFCFSPL